PDDKKTTTNVEKFVSLGRLQPRQGSPESTLWSHWTSTMRNIWLWSETNKITIEQLSALKNSIYKLKFEDFISDPLGEYLKLRDFIGISTELPESISELFSTPLNSRQQKTTPPEKWSRREIEHYQKYAVPIMDLLGYET
ncbi:hypothetical protein N9X45_04580, partial [Pseudomonadales bacterium]|nr:hypothetical protein [Pseudomonadales bacterium]